MKAKFITDNEIIPAIIGQLLVFKEHPEATPFLGAYLGANDSSRYPYKTSGTTCKYAYPAKFQHTDGKIYSLLIAEEGNKAMHITDMDTDSVVATTILKEGRTYSEDGVQQMVEIGILKREVKKNAVRKKSNSFTDVHIPDEEEIQQAITPVEPTGSTLQDKYASIVAATSNLTTKINAQTALADTKELAAAFEETRKQLLSVKSSSVTAPGKVLTAINSFFDNKVTNKWVGNVTNSVMNAKSVQDNIDYLFGLVHAKYEKLVEVGTSLQASKFQFVEQITSLEKLAVESAQSLARYADEADIPMTELALDTQIKSSIEKYKAKLTKIDGAIMAVQATIVALGKNLPSHKADLEDEMAIGDLLSSVDDYQIMYQGIVDLVSGVTKQTAENTHKVIENLMDVQINDTHTLKYLEETAQRGEKFASMLAEKTQTLAAKTTRDAKFIADIASGATLIEAKRNNPLI